ncbi:MAG: hypothetical protein A2020_12070 [Lentisphaerae bacterium GWF2_45_14]|nr:MAG: hypothetical protein A2020_12070 [Lentisphaerae bacterium GWF2_45_14]
MSFPENTLNPEASKKAMRNAIFAQCFGMLGTLLFENGIMLLYLLLMGISQTRVMSYLAVPWVCFFAAVPAAYYSDKFGKKRVGGAGNIFSVLGMAAIASAAFFSSGLLRELVAVGGIIVMALGTSMFQSSWFALLRPVVPAALRGRFFGNLRISWQISCIIVSGITAWILGACGNILVYQLIIGSLGFMIFARLFFYKKIPELEKIQTSSKSFREAFGTIMRIQGYVQFGSYIFLVKIFTAYCPTIFALLEKEVLHLDSSTVVWLANIGLAGSLVGFFIGGWLVDKIGTKPIFIICHIGFALALGVFIMRGFCGGIALMPVLWFSHFFFNLLVAAGSIAITTELLGMLPVENSSMASSVLMAFVYAGTAAAGFLGAAVLNMGFLMEKWEIGNMVMSRFDTILLASAVMILLLTVTLGLIPSVLAKNKKSLE